jgi:hypothetical protein
MSNWIGICGNTNRLEISALLEYYTALCGSSVPTFRDNLSVPSSMVRKSWTSRPLKMKPIGCPETSVQSYHSMLRNIPKERRSHIHRGGSLKSRTLTDSTQFTDEVSGFCGARSTRVMGPLLTRSSLYRILNTAFLTHATLPVLFLHLNE